MDTMTNGSRWNVGRPRTMHKNNWFFSDYYLGDQSILGTCCLLALCFINASDQTPNLEINAYFIIFSLKPTIIHNWFNRNESLTINKSQLLTLRRWIIELSESVLTEPSSRPLFDVSPTEANIFIITEATWSKRASVTFLN